MPRREGDQPFDSEGLRNQMREMIAALPLSAMIMEPSIRQRHLKQLVAISQVPAPASSSLPIPSPLLHLRCSHSVRLAAQSYASAPACAVLTWRAVGPGHRDCGRGEFRRLAVRVLCGAGR